jgi:DNA (cytosine-5)-methyltransferase 1
VISLLPRRVDMTDILIRNIDAETLKAIDTAVPVGMSRNAYLKQILDSGIDHRPTPAMKSPNPGKESDFRFIDLFAGIGGFFMGATRAGGECVFTNEWDKHAVATYRAWTQADHVSSEDIRSLDFDTDIPDHDLLLAGFPCQPFSIAGVSKKNSLGRDHGFADAKQGNLFFAICDIARAKRPAVMLLENVKNLKSHDKGNTWRVILEHLDALDYEVRFQTIDAQGWVPQHRERIFLACFDRQRFSVEEVEGFSFPDPPKGRKKTLSDILEAAPPPEKYMLTENLWKYLQAYAAKHKAQGNGFGFHLVGPNDISRTLSARYYKDGSEILIDQEGWERPRRLTPQEAAKLMGFSKRYAQMLGFRNGEFPQVVSDVQAYKQFGNSVCPLVVEAIVEKLRPMLVASRR